MDRQDQDDRHDGRPDLTAWAPVVLALVVVIVGVTASMFVLRREAMRPTVGDMVVFRAGADDRGPWRVHATATRLGPSGQEAGLCILNSTVMAAGGGSLLVEARLPSDVAPYRVHWAGKRTDTSHHDCGTSADLLMARVDLRKLATAAGGFGVKSKGIRAEALVRTDAGSL